VSKKLKKYAALCLTEALRRKALLQHFAKKNSSLHEIPNHEG
jgi:hypothetical protein